MTRGRRAYRSYSGAWRIRTDEIACGVRPVRWWSPRDLLSIRSAMKSYRKAAS